MMMNSITRMSVLASCCVLLWAASAHGQCLGDADDSGAVDVSDLTAVILDWGCAKPPCAGDVNGDDVTNVTDLTTVILNWGPCPGSCDSPPGVPPNDCCDQATVIAGLDELFDSVTIGFDTTNAGTDGPDDPANPCNSAGGDTQIWQDVWYRVNVPAGLDAGSRLIVSNCLQAQFDSKIAAYQTTDCNALIAGFVDCNEDCAEDGAGFATSTLNIEITAGSSYLVRLGGFSAAGDGSDAASGAGNVSFTLSPPVAPPINDNCVSAIPITEGTTAFDTTGATTDGQAHAGCQFDGQIYNDIWYTYTATSDGVLTVSTCNIAQYDTDLAIYDNGGPAPCPPGDAQLIECNDDGTGCAGFSSQISNIPVSIGEQFLIRVGGFDATSAGTGDLLLDVSAVINNICELATQVAPPAGAAGVPSTVTQNLCEADPDVALPDCDFGIPVNQGVWFITEGDGTTYTASLCGTQDFNWDTRISIYCTTAGATDCDSPFCDPFILFSAMDDTCGFSFQNEERTWCTVAGRTYLVYVHAGFGCGSFTLNMTSDGVECFQATCEPPTGGCCSGGSCINNQLEPDCDAIGGVWVESTDCGALACPPNDDCDAALVIGDGCFAIDNTLATTSPENELPAECEKGFGTGIKNDLWYEYTASGTGTAVFSTCNGFDTCAQTNWDTRMAAYTPDSCGNLVLVACNDDGEVGGQACGTFSTRLEVPVTPGQVLLVRLGAFDDLDGDPDDGVNGGVGTGTLEVFVE